MRIIAGSARGVPLSAPPGLSTRPTADRVKEGLFSAIMPYLPGARVLDMFAGSGQLALEALSRGAASAVACDRDPRACAVIRRNAEKCRLDDPGRLTVLRSSFDRLHLLLPSATWFDLVFIDPPYGTGLAVSALVYLRQRGLLTPGALVAVESDAKDAPAAQGYALQRTYRYGDIAVTLLRRDDSAVEPFPGRSG